MTNWGYSYTFANQVSLPEYDYEKLKEKVFDWQWRCTTRRKWVYSQFDYEYRGITVSGDLDHDLESMNDWVNTTRSISDFVELHHEGKEFIIPNKRDIDKIFEIIQEYTSYVAHTFNHRINLLHYEVKTNPAVKELLNDIIKMQNLANRLFPVMVHLNQDNPAPVTGLLGFLQQDSHDTGYGFTRFDFNPLEKYGLTLEDVTKDENIDKETGLYKAVDVEDYFDPYAYNVVRRVI